MNILYYLKISISAMFSQNIFLIYRYFCAEKYLLIFVQFFNAVITVKNCEVLRTPPKEVISQGMSVTIAYLKRLSQGSVACHRTKLMFVGLGGAGKTRQV